MAILDLTPEPGMIENLVRAMMSVPIGGERRDGRDRLDRYMAEDVVQDAYLILLEKQSVFADGPIGGLWRRIGEKEAKAAFRREWCSDHSLEQVIEAMGTTASKSHYLVDPRGDTAAGALEAHGLFDEIRARLAVGRTADEIMGELRIPRSTPVERKRARDREQMRQHGVGRPGKRRRMWTESTAREATEQWVAQHGRAPRWKDALKDPILPSNGVVRRMFGDWQGLEAAIGVSA